MAINKNYQEVSLGKKSVILENDAAKQQEYIDRKLRSQQDYVDKVKSIESDLQEEIYKLRIQGLNKEASEKSKELEQYKNLRKSAEADLANETIKLEAEASKIVNKKALEDYKELTVKQRREHSKKIAADIKEEIEKYQEEQKASDEYISNLTHKQKTAKGKELEEINKLIAAEENRKNLNKKHSEELVSQLKIAEEATDGYAKAAAKKLGSGINKGLSLLDDKREAKGKEPLRVTGIDKEKRKLEEKQMSDSVKYLREKQKLEKEIQKAEKEGDKAKANAIREQMNLNSEQYKKDHPDNPEEPQVDIKDIGIELAKEVGTGVVGAMGDVLDDIADKVMDQEAIDDVLDQIFGNQGKMLGRLQESGVKWRDTVDDVSDAIGLSGIVSKKSVISKMSELVESGVAYNLELRAFLGTVSENIAHTFDAFDSNLMRMIRLQQADTTAARLGLEATLTKLFNEKFQDTAYLSDASDSITAAIMDSSAMMTKEESLVYEYTVQKWLGSLYALGASSESVSKIAEGVNLLATGQISKLASDSALITMFGLSNSESLAGIADRGITAEKTNELLYKMFNKLSDIASNQTSMVVKSEWANLLGMSVTDLSTFASITDTEIKELYKQTITYDSLLTETETQLKQIKNRLSLSDMVDTAIDNALTGVATNIGSNAVTYGTWKALNILEDFVGEVKIPSVLAAGFGLASDVDLINVAKTAMVGISAVAELISGMSGLVKGPTKLSSWDYAETTERGGGIEALSGGSASNTSVSADMIQYQTPITYSDNITKLSSLLSTNYYEEKSEGEDVGVGNYSSEDMSSVSLQSATDTAYSNSGVTSEELQEERDLTRKMYDAIAGDTAPTILSLLVDMSGKFDTSNNRLLVLSDIDSKVDIANSNLRLLSAIESTLDNIKVTYTAISSNTYHKDSYSAISTLSSELAALKDPVFVPAAETSTSTTPTKNPQNSNTVTGSGSYDQKLDETSLSELIANAVAEGIRQYSFANKMPVEMSYTGGNFQ